MHIKDYLNTICSHVKYKPIHNEIYTELNGHILELKEEFLDEGLPPPMAEKMAIENMGDPNDIGKELNKIYKHKLDYKLLLSILLLLLSAIISLNVISNHMNISHHLFSLIFGSLVGIVISIIIYFYDYKQLNDHVDFIYWVSSIAILLELFFKKQLNYNIDLHHICLPLYVISFVLFVNNCNINKKIYIFKGIFLSCVSIILCYIVSAASTLLLASSYIVLLVHTIYYKSKHKLLHLSFLFVLISLVLCFSILFIVGNESYRLNRLLINFNQNANPNVEGYTSTNREIILQNAQPFSQNFKNINESLLNTPSYFYVSTIGIFRILVWNHNSINDNDFYF